MQSTEILMHEHRVIEQTLGCLEAIADEALETNTLDRFAAGEALDFFRRFADGCHHAKEEQCLFPMLEAKGFPPDDGPTAVMRSEHEQGRKHIRSMAKAAEDAAPGNRDAIQRFAYHARAYAELLRSHISKEDHCLFPMSDRALTEQDQETLAEAFARLEHEDMGAGTHEKYLEIADNLAERFHVPKAFDLSHAAVACGACQHSR